MRFFLELAYNGTRFVGFQRQPKGDSVQGRIEGALSTLLQVPTEVVGCGRTDTGVHARQYFVHFDVEEGKGLQESERAGRFLLSLNALCGRDIVFYRLLPLHGEAHARFDAVSRTYHYHLLRQPSPFLQETAVYLPHIRRVELSKLQETAALLLEFEEFYPFCKTHTDVKHYRCALTRSEWSETESELIYTVTANRFLRGMVRLIVGACVQVATDKMQIEELRQSMQAQTPLRSAWSAPPQGLFLTDIRYPYL